MIEKKYIFYVNTKIATEIDNFCKRNYSHNELLVIMKYDLIDDNYYNFFKFTIYDDKLYILLKLLFGRHFLSYGPQHYDLHDRR